MTFRVLLPVLLAFAPVGAARQGNAAEPQPMDAQRAILAAFDRYQVVAGLGVTNKDTDDLLLALVRNPAFAAKVNDIAIECGNSLYQPILDRYVAGESVSLADVRQVWRNTTQPSCGFSGFYEQLVLLVRRVNEKLPASGKLRVLACDPPIDWGKVKSVADLRPFMERDRTIADVMMKEVLAKHRKALMLYGINHVRHGLTTAVGRYEAKYPNVTFVVVDHHGFGRGTPLAQRNDSLERRMASWPAPSLMLMKGSWLADLACNYFDPDLGSRSCKGYPGVDAYLYLGPRNLLFAEPMPAAIALDKEYLAELQRRATIKGSSDGPMGPTAALQREAGASAFLYNPPIRRP